jgi:cytochrome P450
MTTLPRPPGWHLARWARDPLRLLEDGARTGEVFALRLWRPVVVGYRPDWNRAVLGDLDTFRSKGSLSGLTPYLSGGVVGTDTRRHRDRRRELNPIFHSQAVSGLAERMRTVVARSLPAGPFEALSWSSRVVRDMLNEAFFGGCLDDRLLAAFLGPLQRPIPSPLLPRPRLFAGMDAAIARIIASPPAGTLAASLAGMDRPVEELRIALAAGYDTTAHTVAFALWHVAEAPRWRRAEALGPVLDEVQRLHPAGWIGSRVAARDTVAAGVPIKGGTLVLYSPYLTHRDHHLWADAGEFRPDRFTAGRPAWGFIPFAAGRRTCLGVHLARQMMRAALEPFCGAPLGRVGGDLSVTAGITLRPDGPLWLRR